MPPYRRDYHRYIIESPVSLVMPGGAEKTSFLRDLSSRGAGILGDSFFALGESLTIGIDLPVFFEGKITKKAKVAWCKQVNTDTWQAGLDFGVDNLINFK